MKTFTQREAELKQQEIARSNILFETRQLIATAEEYYEIPHDVLQAIRRVDRLIKYYDRLTRSALTEEEDDHREKIEADAKAYAQKLAEREGKR